MAYGDAGEGFASNYGYGGMPGTTTGIAAGGYAATGNPQIGAQAKYQQAALNALANRYPKQAYMYGTAAGPPKMTGIQNNPLDPLAIAKKKAYQSTSTPKPDYTWGDPESIFNQLSYTGQGGPFDFNDTPWNINNTPYPRGSNPYPETRPQIGGYDWSQQPQPVGGYTRGTSPTPSGYKNAQIGGYQSGFRQFGGPVAPGGQYTVGENGPETFQPSQPGQIVPNPADQLGGMQPQQMRDMMMLQQQFGGGGQGGMGGMGGQQSQPMTQPPQPQRQTLADHLIQRGMRTRPPQPQAGGGGPTGPGPGPGGWGMGGNGLGLEGILSRFAA